MRAPRKANLFLAGKFSPRARKISAHVESELRELVPRVLGRESAKVIAFHLGVPQRTAENWQAGLNLPNLPHFFALAELFPELRDKSLEWGERP